MYYPHPRQSPVVWVVLGTLVLLAAITVTAILSWRRAPWIIIGWLWFLGTLVPVIGLLQVGAQARADRYTYLPQIGVIIFVDVSRTSAIFRWHKINRIRSLQTICLRPKLLHLMHLTV
jgi:hypothetical protein